MDPQADPSDLSLTLPRDAYYQLVHTLRSSLPRPVTDTQQDLARRDNATIALVASLLPATAAEANLATQHVAASAQPAECLRVARQYADSDHTFFLKCTAHAASMMREARAAMRMLERAQAARQKRDADQATCDRAAWTEHCAVGLMAQALSGDPPASAAQPTPPPAPEPEPPAEPTPDPIASAEQYAVLYPQRAALIRRLGRVPDNPPFGPPEPHLVQALVTARTPALLALDSPPGDGCAT